MRIARLRALLLGTALAGSFPLMPSAIADQLTGCSPSALGSGGGITCGPAGNTYGGFDNFQSFGIHFEPTADTVLTIQPGTVINGVHTTGFNGVAAGVSLGLLTSGPAANANLEINNSGTIDLSYYSATFTLNQIAATGIGAYATGAHNVTINNSGAISSFQGIFTRLDGDGTITINNTGTLTGQQLNGTQPGTQIFASVINGNVFSSAVVNNSGAISGADQGISAGAFPTAGVASASVTNTAAISANWAIDAEAGGTTSATVTVHNTGQLTSNNYTAIYGYASATTGPASIDITNTGNISSNSEYYIDANLSGGASGFININTSGALTDGVGINAGASAVPGATISIVNSGSITSSATGITTDDAPTSIANNGQIVSTAIGGTAISMGAGANRLTIGGGSSITGFVTNGSTNGGTFSVANNNVLAFGGTGSGTFDLGQVALSPAQLGYALSGNTRSSNSPVADTTHQYQGFSNFEKTGTSTITVTGTSANNGGWTVSGGQLNVAGTIGNVAVTNGGTLGGSGSVGNVSVASGGIISGVQGQTLTTGNLTLAAGAHTLATLGGNSAAPLFNVTGNVALNGSLDLVSSTGTFANGVTRLFNYGGALSGSGLTLGTIMGGINVPDASIQTSVGGQVNLVTAPTTASFWNGGNGGQGTIQGGNGTWNANTIWTNVSANNSATIQPAAFAIFQGAAGQVNVSGSAGPVGIGGMQFVTSGYVVSGDPIALTSAQTTVRVGDGTRAGATTTATISAPLTGSAQLVKTDFGTLVLNGVNTYSGGTQVTGGTVAIGNSSALGAGLVSLNEGTTLSFLNGLTLNNNLVFPQPGDPVIDTGGNNVTLAGAISGVGDLTKIGSGTLNLTGLSSYTGATNVNAGTLSVNGSIAASSLTTVNAGATLGGNGTVGNTLINGGTLSPGNSIGTLNVSGNLVFTAASAYLVEVSASTADRVNVSGTATLGGATVNASFAPGSYVSRQYTIVNARGGVIGIFNSQVNTNLPSNFTSSLSYDASNAYLNLALNFAPSGPTAPAFNGFNINQINVARALVDFFNRTGGIPLAFGGLTPTGLGIVSGELATGTQQTSFDAMDLFLGLITDPFTAGRGSASAGAVAYAEEALAYAAKRRPGDALAAIYRKAPPISPTFAARWNVWAAGFGGSQTSDGNATLGSNAASARIYGTAVGADYFVSPTTVAGFALAGGGTSFSVANNGNGRSDLFQAGAFVRHTQGSAYVTAALAYGWQDVTTDRTVAIAGIDRLNAHFTANAWSGRIEGGNRYTTSWLGGVGLTPYAAGQVTALDLPGYAEQAILGANMFALGYASKTVTDPRTELGVRTDKAFAVSDAVLTLRGRAAWAHDFNIERSIAATFQTLPGSAFVVNGAAQARDSVLTTASAEMKFISGISLAATFESAFSDVTRSYAGKGVVRYQW